MLSHSDFLEFSTEVYEALSISRIEGERLHSQVLEAIANVDAATFAVCHGHAKASELLDSIGRMEVIYHEWTEEKRVMRELEELYKRLVAEQPVKGASVDG